MSQDEASSNERISYDKRKANRSAQTPKVYSSQKAAYGGTHSCADHQCQEISINKGCKGMNSRRNLIARKLGKYSAWNVVFIDELNSFYQQVDPVKKKWMNSQLCPPSFDRARVQEDKKNPQKHIQEEILGYKEALKIRLFGDGDRVLEGPVSKKKKKAATCLQK